MEKEFIESFLDPEHEWEDPYKVVKLKFYDKWKNLINWNGKIDWDYIAIHIKSMKYKSFLQTQYWKIISDKKKKMSKFKCEKCKQNDILNVHHNSYENHGYELFNMKDLIVLCEKCHKIEHGII